eukprot:CAMPEP_0204179382 /NCGR_PEP_ID=MMETSP0361-20130328/50119_1 /ASSEMBLY_ACC=CAM_ASM_000343 /TAXON_ID=268821 /ORGANISM="Scrippsiella Hangoei, Strain SHTV-5" /LENGTH=119 /DNA_ID=CAMNT_0051138631 /DNA_START=302 /DNA_END=662 /DNA_ORIENTATION=-
MIRQAASQSEGCDRRVYSQLAARNLDSDGKARVDVEKLNISVDVLDTCHLERSGTGYTDGRTLTERGALQDLDEIVCFAATVQEDPFSLGTFRRVASPADITISAADWSTAITALSLLR